jgi:signal transduction histidine kinase
VGIRVKLALGHALLFLTLQALLLAVAWWLEPAAVRLAIEHLEREGLLLVAAGVVLGLLAAGTWWVSARALAPLARLASVAEVVRETGNFGLRAPAPGSRDEVGRVVETFNALVAHVEKLLQAQQQFLADTSHELRTPLTVIRGNLDLLQRDLDAQTRLECATEAQEEAARMSRLVDDLLFLSRSAADQTIRHERFHLDELALEVAERMRPFARGCTLEVGPLEAATVNGDRERMRQLIANLLDNAMRYTPQGGTIGLQVLRRGPSARIIVKDSGVGIAPEHLPRIFDRFYRVGDARDRSQGGTGLGLAIVRHVAEAHGGIVRVQSRPGEGSEFTVVLPAEPSWRVG